jgi:hypothetical protein
MIDENQVIAQADVLFHVPNGRHAALMRIVMMRQMAGARSVAIS